MCRKEVNQYMPLLHCRSGARLALQQGLRDWLGAVVTSLVVARRTVAMKRQITQGSVIALVVLLCGCVAHEQNGDGVALIREIMIESAKPSEGRKSETSSERTIQAVRDWRRGQGKAGGAG